MANYLNIFWIGMIAAGLILYVGPAFGIASVSPATVYVNGYGTVATRINQLAPPLGGGIVQLIVNAQTTGGQVINGLSISLFSDVNNLNDVTQTYCVALSGTPPLCFSPATFNVPSSTNLWVTPQDFGPYHFQQWSDGTTVRSHQINILGATTMMALYSVTTSSTTSSSTSSSTTGGATVTEPMQFTLQGTGTISPQVILNGCNATPNVLYADGRTNTVTLVAGCTFTANLPAGYTFTQAQSVTSVSLTSCATGTCQTVSIFYYVGPSSGLSLPTPYIGIGLSLGGVAGLVITNRRKRGSV